MATAVFQRIEKKYLITKAQCEGFLKAMEPYIMPDEYGEYSPASIYFDTPDWTLARRSIGGPVFKEKFRLRTYGVPTDDSPAFLEIKRKYDGVVYKRRVTMPYREAYRYLQGDFRPADDSQIFKEIERFREFYGIRPAMLVACERRAFKAREGDGVRLTIDKNIRCRREDLDLSHGFHGTPLFDENLYLMEIKIAGAMPLPMAEALTELKIYPRGFSKYGSFYKKKLAEEQELCLNLY